MSWKLGRQIRTLPARDRHAVSTVHTGSADDAGRRWRHHREPSTLGDRELWPRVTRLAATAPNSRERAQRNRTRRRSSREELVKRVIESAGEARAGIDQLVLPPAKMLAKNRRTTPG